MSENIFLVNKPPGLTMGELMAQFHRLYPEAEKPTYAGRLDPLASGLVLVLAGEKRFHKEGYLSLDKVYEVDVLLGMRTDTQDVLGMPTFMNSSDLSSDMESIIATFEGSFEQSYPLYSSKPVNGKPLWHHAREGNDVEIPTKEITIHSIDMIGEHVVSFQELVDEIESQIAAVHGDFRQAIILKAWREVYERNNDANFPVIRLRVHCSSGTYMRGLAERIGIKVGGGGIALSIHRTHIGSFKLSDALDLAGDR